MVGSLATWGNDYMKDIMWRIGTTVGAMAGFGNIWRSRETKLHLPDLQDGPAKVRPTYIFDSNIRMLR